MNKYKARLKDINSLEFAENKAKSRLTLIRRSMVRLLEPGCEEPHTECAQISRQLMTQL